MAATVIINDGATSFSDQNDCHSVSASLDSSRLAKFSESQETLFLARQKTSTDCFIALDVEL